MTKASIIVFVILFFSFGCKQTGSKSDSSNADTVDSTKFFQVTQYLKSEIQEVNETPYFIYKIDIKNNKKDSTAINTSIFNDLSKQFYTPDINAEENHKLYKENIFHDQTTKSYTISYSAVDKDLPIQNLEVLLEEDGKTVKRLFIRKFFDYSDSSAIEQLSWKPKQSFQINRLVQQPDKSETSQQTIVVWNEKS